MIILTQDLLTHSEDNSVEQPQVYHSLHPDLIILAF